MRVALACCAVAVAAPLCAGPAQAAPPRAGAGQAAGAEALFRAGRFAEAAAAGRARGDAQGLALAARATLMRGAYLTEDAQEAGRLVAQGLRDAEAALRLDPTSYDALLQKGSGLGYAASLTQSRSKAKAARRIFEELTTREPDRPEAWLALGAWHGEAIDSVGPLIAAAALGAKRSAMVRAFSAAADRMPASPVPPAYLALLLLRHDLDHAREAGRMLARACAMRPSEGYEAIVQRGGRQVLALLQAGDPRGARELARELGSFGKLD